MTPSTAPTKPTAEAGPLLAFGAHPDDVEFGCGGVLALERHLGRAVHIVVGSRGEAASHGSPAQRVREARAAAARLGATIEFVALGGDAHFAVSVASTLRIAAILRRVRPAVVLAPSTVPHQHPDHACLGAMVRDAARLARYGGVKELCRLPAHAIDQLFLYAITTEAEPVELGRVFVDVSVPAVLRAWTDAMAAHASQMKTRNYLELQLTRARLNGLRAGVEHAVALFPADPLVVGSLASLGRGARRF